MKKITLFVALSALVASCSDTKLVENHIDPFLKVTISDSTNLELQAANANTYNLLGHGYDATGFFFNALSGRAKVLDIEKLIELHPGRFLTGYPRSHYSTTESGLTATALVEKLSEETDDYFRPISDNSKFNMFCGQLTAAFNKSNLSSNKYVFGFYQEYILERSFTYWEVTDTLKTYLTDAFKSDIQNESPENILRKYGTHVLTSVMLGGKIQVLYKSTIPSGDKELLSAVGLSRAVQLTMGQGMSFTNTNQVFTNQDQEVFVSTAGGVRMKPWSGMVSIDTLTAPVVNINPWFDTLESSPSLIYVPSGHMIPIYELVSDEAKRTALKNAYNAYFLKSKLGLSGL